LSVNELQVNNRIKKCFDHNNIILILSDILFRKKTTQAFDQYTESILSSISHESHNQINRKLQIANHIILTSSQNN
jgi:hypothetical protein